MLITELAIQSAREGRTVDVPDEETIEAVDAVSVSEDETGSVSTTQSHSARADLSKLSNYMIENNGRGWNWFTSLFTRS